MHLTSNEPELDNDCNADIIETKYYTMYIVMNTSAHNGCPYEPHC